MSGYDEEDDQLEVELGLVRNCESRLYDKTTKWLEFGLWTMGFSLEADKSDKLGLKNQLRLSKQALKAPRLLQVHAKWLAYFWNSLGGFIFRRIAPLYFFVKYLTIISLQSDYDKISRTYQVRNRFTNCANNGSSVDWSPLVATWNRLEFIGSPFTGTTFSFFYPLLIVYPLVLVIRAWVTAHFFVVRLDWLAFLNQPLEERRRMQAELDRIVAQIIEAAGRWGREVILKLEYLRPEAYCKAAHLSVKWHKRMLSMSFHFIYGSFVAAAVSTIVTQLNFIIYILNLSLKAKLAQVECRNRHPPVDLAVWSRFTHNWDAMSKSEIARYASYDSSSWSQYLYLLLVVEPCKVFTWQSLLSLSEASFIQFMGTFWTSIGMKFYLMIVFNQLVWIWQIKHQLDECLRVFRHKQSSQSLLLRTISGTYLNYTLFKRQYRTQRQLAWLFSCQALVWNLLHLMTMSMTKRAINSSNATALYGMIGNIFFFFLASLNVYFGFYSYLYLQIERLMRQIANLMAAYERNLKGLRRRSPSLEFWRELWSRQLLEAAAISKFYGINIFGIHVNFTNLIQVNVYPLAVLAYLI